MVAFQIEDICRQVCDHDICEAIRKLPKNLSETYNDIWSKINKMGKAKQTPLQAAAEMGQLEAVEKPLTAKADVNAEAASYSGRTALQAAAEAGDLEVVERLLAAKADVNAKAASSYGRTALRKSLKTVFDQH